MALEAARQLSQVDEPHVDRARLNDISFGSSLPLDRFQTPSTTVELHLNARQDAGKNAFQFEISSYGSQGDSTKHCHGAFSLMASDSMPARMSFGTISPDAYLLKAVTTVAKSLGQTAFAKLNDLYLSEHGSQGSFSNSQEQHENFCIDPIILSSVISLMPLLGVRQNLPTMRKLCFVKSMVAPLLPAKASSGTFQTSHHPKKPYGTTCNATILVNDDSLNLSGLYYEAVTPVQLEPQLESLLFKPVLMADPTSLKSPKPLNELLELVFHKWPMCDVGFADMPDELFTSLCTDFESRVSGQRRRFRSLERCDDIESNVVNDNHHARSSSTSRFHLCIVGKSENIIGIMQRLHPRGLACVRTSDSDCLTDLESCMDLICPIEGISDDDTWTLWRMQDIPTSEAETENIIAFTAEEDRQWLPNAIKSAELIPLVPDLASQYSNLNNTKRNAVVIDTAKTAVLTNWPGSQLIPWLRTLLQSSQSLLWVTLDHSENLIARGPFTNIAGSLLRTLQAEQPALKVNWLRFKYTDVLSQAEIQDHILRAFNAMLDGDNEILREVRNGCVDILRFVPDDGLSAAVGAIPPQPIFEPDSGQSYEISLATPRAPVILAPHRQSGKSDSDNDKHLIEVEVEASVIDQSDVSAYLGSRKPGDHTNTTRQNSDYGSRGLGLFFAGHVLSDPSEIFAKGAEVVGWQSGAHRGRLRISSSKIHSRHPHLNTPIWAKAGNAAAHFSALATAICILDGVARLRKDDLIRIDLDGILAEAVTRECHSVGADVLRHDDQRKAEFVVSIDSLGMLCLNDKAIDIEGYLESAHGSSVISRAWNTCEPYKTKIEFYDLASVKRAFEASAKCPWSAVLVHSGHEKVASTVPIYRKPSKLFSATGAYVIVGGLGGLGRFVCAWMVENGAKAIYAISRSGLKSTEAQDAYNAIKSSGASLEVLKADACDQKAMAEALAQIRKRHSIIGVMNMAMLLGDAPFMNMTVRLMS